jgi:RNA recognition motif-containing protein
MSYDRITGHSDSPAFVVLRDESSALAAVSELDGAALFDRTVVLTSSPCPYPNTFVSVRYGWFASTSPDYRKVDTRGPSLEYPKDVFAPLREQRTVVFVNFPRVSNSSSCFYRLLHNFNVIWADFINIKDKDDLLISVSFTTRDEAERAKQQYNGFILEGRRLGCNTWQIPRKYLGASWDSGRPGVHYSGRDQGSAVGTNFEEVRRSVEVPCCVSELIKI